MKLRECKAVLVRHATKQTKRGVMHFTGRLFNVGYDIATTVKVPVPVYVHDSIRFILLFSSTRRAAQPPFIPSSLRLDGGSSLLVLLEEPGDAPVDAVLQGPGGVVAQDRLGLCDVVVARHGGHDGALAGEGGGLLEDAEDDLAGEAHGGAEAAGEGPDALGALVVAGGAPDGAGEVPEVAGGVVCDEEDLAVDALVVEGRGGGAGGEEQGAGGEEVGVGDVADVGEVEDVGVVAELDVGLAGAVGAQEAGEGLGVAFAEDAGGAEGRGDEVGGGLAVGLDDELLGGGLCKRGRMAMSAIELR